MNYFSCQESKTALFHAVEKGHVLIVKELLDAGANTETQNKVCNMLQCVFIGGIHNGGHLLFHSCVLDSSYRNLLFALT